MEGVLEKDKLNISIDSTDPSSGISILNNSAEDQDQAKPDEELEANGTMQNSTEPLSTEDIFHVIQFCHLCAIGKIPPISYSLSSDPETTSWFKNLTRSMMNEKTHPAKRQAPSTPDSDSESGVSSPELKMSKKDNYLINTMIKLHDTMDKSSRSKEEKEPGFNRLEAHRKNLILNASAIPPFTKAADNPTEFYTSFLSKKSQLKAKDMLMHRFHTDKVAFNPNPTFITNLWNSEFFWILPDHPSGNLPNRKCPYLPPLWTWCGKLRIFWQWSLYVLDHLPILHPSFKAGWIICMIIGSYTPARTRAIPTSSQKFCTPLIAPFKNIGGLAHPLLIEPPLMIMF
jgi:hypothetical protein